MNPQQQLAQILVRADLAAELRADPDAFARAHGADPAVSRRLSALPPDGLAVASAITRDVRARRIAALFPASFAVAGSSAGRLLRAAEECGVLTGAAAIAELTGLLTAEAGRSGGARAGLLADVIGYEGACHRARLRADAPGPPAGEDRPVRAPGVSAAFFPRDVAEVRRLALAGRPLPGGPAVPTHYALRAVAGSGAVRSHRLPPLLGRVLAACDGSRTVAGLARAAGISAADVRRALAVLADAGLVAGAPDGPRPSAAQRDAAFQEGE